MGYCGTGAGSPSWKQSQRTRLSPTDSMRGSASRSIRWFERLPGQWLRSAASVASSPSVVAPSCRKWLATHRADSVGTSPATSSTVVAAVVTETPCTRWVRPSGTRPRWCRTPDSRRPPPSCGRVTSTSSSGTPYVGPSSSTRAEVCERTSGVEACRTTARERMQCLPASSSAAHAPASTYAPCRTRTSTPALVSRRMAVSEFPQATSSRRSQMRE